MKIEGTVIKDGRFWVVSIPLIDGMTQGYTRKEALFMAEGLVQCMMEDDHFPVHGSYVNKNKFFLETDKSQEMLALVLRRQRQKCGLSAKQVARKLGQSSPNAYYRFESGKSAPSFAMLERLLKAVGATTNVGIAL